MGSFKRMLVWGLSALLFTGCASMEQANHYRAEAKAHDFAYFFPAESDVKFFDTLDEAYEYVNVADTKLISSIGKNYTQGLAARLKGKMNLEEKRVTVGHFFAASSATESIDLSNASELEKRLKSSVSVISVYLIFYEGRGVSISSFYLDSSYTYRDNSQIPYFYFAKERYDADYPIGWRIDGAFKYLRKEAD